MSSPMIIRMFGFRPAAACCAAASRAAAETVGATLFQLVTTSAAAKPNIAAAPTQHDRRLPVMRILLGGSLRARCPSGYAESAKLFTRQLLSGSTEDLFPLGLHVHDRPSPRSGFVERLVESADRRLPVVRELPLGVSVVDETQESRAGSGGGPLQHLAIAVRIAERKHRPPSYELVDARRFARAVVDEIDLRQAHEHRLVVLHLELGFYRR